MPQYKPVSIRDGKLKRKDLYLTTDVSFAAYLVTRGYELLGAIDEGLINAYGKSIMNFGLMPTNEEILNAHQPMARVEADINAKWDEFENMVLKIPHDPENGINIKDYVTNYRTCFRVLDKAIRKP